MDRDDATSIGTTLSDSARIERHAARACQTPNLDEGPRTPTACFNTAQRYLALLAGADVPHLFQPYYDANRQAPNTAWMSRLVYGCLAEVWPTLILRQKKGAAIAVTMAETDGRGRKSANMIRPRAVWIESDGPVGCSFPLCPSFTVETSPGKHHYIYVCRELSWDLWHGVQQTLIADYGSDQQAALRTQVLRLPGTLHLKNPAHPHLVRIVEGLTTERAYMAAEIAAAFPPRSYEPNKRPGVRTTPALHRRTGVGRNPAADWQPEDILSALRAIDARLRASGPFTAQGDRPDDQPIVVDWSRRDWWLRAVACLHHASGGSGAGFKLSCAASGGDASNGLIGCPSTFNAADQRRVWDSLTNGELAELRGAAVTIRTIYWIAQRYCGWGAGRRGRPIGQPRPAREVSAEAQAVADAGRWAVSVGLDRVRQLHVAVASQRIAERSLLWRVLEEIRKRLDPKTGVVGIGSLAGMAATLGCATETLRGYLRRFAAWRLIVKNEGNATSMLGTSGITIALDFPEGIRETIGPQPTPKATDPPISEQTGMSIPQFREEAVGNPSRSPYSHGEGEGRAYASEDFPGATFEPPIWPKLTTTERDQLLPWLEELPEAIAEHCRALAIKRGLRGTLGRLIEVLEFAANRLDPVSLHIVLEGAARRICFRGPDRPPADLAEMTPGECLGRLLRKLVAMLSDEQQIADTPGYAAINRRKEFVTPKSATKSAQNAYAAAKGKECEP